MMMLRAVHHLLVRGKMSGAAAEASSRAGLACFSAASSSQRLAGKVAVITGEASGMGKATAVEFVRNGAKVILTDIQDDLGRAVADDLGPDASYARCDVTDEAQIAAAVDLAVARHGATTLKNEHRRARDVRRAMNRLNKAKPTTAQPEQESSPASSTPATA